MTYLITGACGLLGSNLAAEILRRGERLVAFDNLGRFGAERNLAWLRELGDFEWVHGDVRDRDAVENAVRAARPDRIFHLAGQVAMTTSIANPRLDFETNALGSFNVIEAARRAAPEAGLFYSSTNKVYGELDAFGLREAETRYVCDERPHGFDESTPLDFRSPYGCSKGAADQCMLDAYRVFGLRTAVFRHSTVFGPRQFATFDQGWIGWFVRQALETARDPEHEFTIAGDGKQVRDVLFASDLVACYLQASENLDKVAGQAFNVGGGQANSLSLLELFARLEARLGVRLRPVRTPWRLSDQKIFVADVRKAAAVFGWKPKVDVAQGLEEMVAWTQASN